MKSKILVIDDEENIRFAFKTHLSDEGHEVQTAEDFASALEVISNTNLDVIIADIILGGRTGIDILQEVKNKGMNCPVIMITGEPNIKTAAEAVRLGAFDYLSKPVHKETFLQVTAHALKHKTLLDEKTRLEAENERYRRNLEAIFGSLNEGIITVDHEMQVIEANEAVKNICGLPPSEIIGNEFANALNQCHKPCHDVLKGILKTKDLLQFSW